MRFACGGKISILTDWSAAARLSHQILTNFLTLCSHKYTNTNTRRHKHKYTTKQIHNHTDTNTQNYTNKNLVGSVVQLASNPDQALNTLLLPACGIWDPENLPNFDHLVDPLNEIHFPTLMSEMSLHYPVMPILHFLDHVERS